MSENREPYAYKQPRSWVRIILWCLIFLCHVFIAIGEILMGEQAVLSTLRIVLVVMFALVLVGEIRKRTEVDAQGVTYCPGLTRVYRLTWQEVARVTHRAGSFWKADILTFYPVQGNIMLVPSTPEVYAIVAQHVSIEEE